MAKIPFYFKGWVVFHHTHTHTHTHTYIYISHIFFIHSSVDGYLHCFYILTIANNAAMNTRIHVSFELVLLFFSDIYLKVWLLGHMKALFLLFWETSLLFSTVTMPTYIPINSVGGFPFFHIITNICYLCSYWR